MRCELDLDLKWSLLRVMPKEKLVLTSRDE
jgi:hypothetical protein